MMKNKSLLLIVLVPAIILLIPAAAMLFKVDGWAWGPLDFVAMWALMAGAGFAYKLATRKTVSVAYRSAAGLAVGTAFILTWINGAVGIIGSEDNPANLMYLGVLIVGLIGVAIARFQADRMALALFAMALAQMLVPLIALIISTHDFAPGLLPVLGLNAVFSLSFIGSALLFRHAARQSHTRALATN
jgi:hypothetical protein